MGTSSSCVLRHPCPLTRFYLTQGGYECHFHEISSCSKVLLYHWGIWWTFQAYEFTNKLSFAPLSLERLRPPSLE